MRQTAVRLAAFLGRFSAILALLVALASALELGRLWIASGGKIVAPAMGFLIAARLFFGTGALILLLVWRAISREPSPDVGWRLVAMAAA